MSVILTIIVISGDEEKDQVKDETIRFTSCTSRPDVVDISTSFCGKTCNYKYKTSMNRDRCPHYALTMVRSLIKDNDPFDFIQLNSSIFPSVMYKIADLAKDESTIFSIIRDMFHVTFDSIIKYVPSKVKDEEIDIE
jgi:hypothetical protein